MRTWAFLAAVALVLSGCGGASATRDALEQGLTDSHSAVASSRLALLTYQQGRTTHAATETALADMSEQIAAVAPQLAEVTITTAKEEAQRDDAQGAVALGAAAVVKSRDDFARDLTPDVEALERADAAIKAALEGVRAAG